MSKVFHLMSGVNETRLLVQNEWCDCKCRLNETVRNSKHGTTMNATVSVKNQMIWVFVKSVACGILARVIVNVIKHVKLINIQMLKIVHVKNV